MADQSQFDKLLVEAKTAVTGASSAAELARLRTEYLGRKGKLTQLLRDVANLAVESRAAFGQHGNAVKQELTSLFAATAAKLGDGKSPQSSFDVTLPGTHYPPGHPHPISLVVAEIEDLFLSLGFSIAEGPEVEDDWHNFAALNIGPDHPARDMQDTFYVKGSENKQGGFRLLPRTHTSGVQIRAMQETGPPIRIIAPGKTYRNEAEDATHSAIFTQVEGLMVDQTTTFTDLKGILLTMARSLLGQETKLRFRPSFFPYTEPSAEIDMSAPGVRGGAWIELGGAGMVHPKVLANAGYDPQRVRGFAFGIGPDRLAMLKYQITDVRQLYRPDIRILEQF